MIEKKNEEKGAIVKACTGYLYVKRDGECKGEGASRNLWKLVKRQMLNVFWQWKKKWRLLMNG